MGTQDLGGTIFCSVHRDTEGQMGEKTKEEVIIRSKEPTENHRDPERDPQSGHLRSQSSTVPSHRLPLAPQRDLTALPALHPLGIPNPILP